MLTSATLHLHKFNGEQLCDLRDELKRRDVRVARLASKGYLRKRLSAALDHEENEVHHPTTSPRHCFALSPYT